VLFSVVEQEKRRSQRGQRKDHKQYKRKDHKVTLKNEIDSKEKLKKQC
jgi:hypothetical protein